MRTWKAIFVGVGFALVLAHHANAIVPPKPSRSLPELERLFPSPDQLPVGLVLVEEGSRTADEIAATFVDPNDADQVLQHWGWAFNAYRIYEAEPAASQDTPRRLEISLHQFANNTGAAYALPYFAHGRAVATGQTEEPAFGGLRPCEAAVTGDIEATRYLRAGDLLIRVTSTMHNASEGQVYYLALGSANQLAYDVLGNAGSSVTKLDQTCL